MIQDEVNRAVEVLRAGGIILYPTDTVWGIGCDATNPEAVQKIYDLKGSVNKKGMIVLLDKPINVARYVRSVPEIAWDLMELTDKPLTLILDGAVGVAPNRPPPAKAQFPLCAGTEHPPWLPKCRCSSLQSAPEPAWLPGSIW